MKFNQNLTQKKSGFLPLFCLLKIAYLNGLFASVFGAMLWKAHGYWLSEHQFILHAF
jgi:hypothetical protein